MHYFTTHEIESQRICPRCGISLRTIDLKLDGRFLIERCDECLGLFFDPGELEVLLEATVANVFNIDRCRLDAINSTMRANDYPVSYIKCPICSKIMNRVNFGAKSGVIVDRCRDHGVWLDGGELRHLFEWMKAGGQLLDREKRNQLVKDEADQERRKKTAQPATYGVNDAYADFDTYGNTLRNEDPDLFQIIASAIRFFAK